MWQTELNYKAAGSKASRYIPEYMEDKTAASIIGRIQALCRTSDGSSFPGDLQGFETSSVEHGSAQQ